MPALTSVWSHRGHLGGVLILPLLLTTASFAAEFAEPPKWTQSAIWYQIFVERFRNGDPENDPVAESMAGSYPGYVPDGWAVTDWGHDWYEIESFDDPATPENEFSYHGWLGVKTLPELRKVGVRERRKGYPFEGNLPAEVKSHVFEVTRRWMDPNGGGDPSDGVDGFRLDVAPSIYLPGSATHLGGR